MNAIANVPPLSLADAAHRYKEAVATILEAYDALAPGGAVQVTPRQLDAGVRQFLTAALRTESTAATPVDPEEVTRSGDYGITLLTDLGTWAQRLGLDDLETEFDTIALAFADWVARHAGEIRTIEPVVDALANQANRERDPHVLERLTQLARRMIQATAPAARIGLTRTHPSTPWRTLNLNCGIVATRTHNPALMERVFDELVRNLPADAPRFFAEGMQQMEKSDFPPPVRAVMARFFDRWTRPRMH